MANATARLEIDAGITASLADVDAGTPRPRRSVLLKTGIEPGRMVTLVVSDADRRRQT